MNTPMHRTLRICATALATIAASAIAQPTTHPAEPPAGTPPAATATTPSLPETPAGAMLGKVLKLFDGDAKAMEDTDFSPAFLKAVPMAKLRLLTTQMRGEHGSLTYVGLREGAKDTALVARTISSKSAKPFLIRLGLDANGQIETLLLQPDSIALVPPIKSWEELDAHAQKAAETATIGVFELLPKVQASDGDARIIRPVHTLHLEQPLAIGSAFKLWILGALAEETKAKKIAWDQPLAIQAERKSLPSGVLQDRPAGDTLPVSEYALKMISISDNTAADHLLHLVGRPRVEAFMQQHCLTFKRNLPMLTTRDMFVLKLSGSDDLPKAYLAEDEAGRRAMLAPEGKVGSGTPQLVAAAFWKAPRFIDTLEWFAAPIDLAQTMSTIDELLDEPGADALRAALTANPGVPLPRNTWPLIAYKGGSEPGVLNLTWLLHRDDGRRFVLTIGYNDTKRSIDDAQGVAIAARAAEYLASWDRKENAGDKPPVKPQTP